MTGFSLGNESVVRWNIHCLSVKLDPGKQISGKVGHDIHCKERENNFFLSKMSFSFCVNT